MKPTIEQDEMFPEGVNTPSWEIEEVTSVSHRSTHLIWECLEIRPDIIFIIVQLLFKCYTS